VTKKQAINLDQFFMPASGGDDLTFLIGATSDEVVQRATEQGFPLLQLTTQSIAPDPHQLRHLPDPAELARLAAGGDQAAAVVVAGLRELGQSMRDHGQIQPVVVYCDADPVESTVTHRLLNGHRRWSAAVLLDLPTVSAIQVPRPTEMTRLLHQFEENERREGFSDMERAWALIAMKEALQTEAGGEVPWDVLEDQLQLSTSRRHDLLRLLRFPAEGQAVIMRYGWSEWTLRSLHMAINKGDVLPDAATVLLRTLAQTADVTASTVASLVEKYRQDNRQRTSGTPEDSSKVVMATVASKDVALVFQRMGRLRQSIEQLREQISSVEDRVVRHRWRAEAESLRNSLESILRDLNELT